MSRSHVLVHHIHNQSEGITAKTINVFSSKMNAVVD